MRKIKLITALIISIIIISGCEFKLLPETAENTNDNDGLSFETAIVVPEYYEEDGIPWEYDWITANACLNDNGVYTSEWQFVELYQDKNYDLIKVSCNNNATIDYYFMIDNFYKNWINDGSSFEKAVEVQSTDPIAGIAWEYEWLEFNACLDDEGYSHLSIQSLQTFEGKNYDVMEVVCNNSTTSTYHFMIDNFFGNY